MPSFPLQLATGTKNDFQALAMDLTADILSELAPKIQTPIEALSEFFHNLDCTTLGENFPWLDSQIQINNLGYIFVGACLQRIRHHNLYRFDYGDFKEYCRHALGRSYNYCLRLIQAAQTAYLLIQEKFDRLPTCESQIRPIVQVLPKDKFGNIDLTAINPEAPSASYLWEEVLKNADEKNNGLITADLVQKTVNAELQLETKQQQERKVKIAIANKYRQRLSRIALEEGKSEAEILEELIDRRYLEMDFDEYPETDSSENEPAASESDDDIPSDPLDWENDLDLLVSHFERRINPPKSEQMLETTAKNPSRSPPTVSRW
ncbi:MAG TPA: hypothetical protein V6D28_27950 [Leptolyngbyaceae cyanobacterium]